MVLKVDRCSKWKAAESAIGESPIIKVTVTGWTAVNFYEMLKLQTLGVERRRSTAKAASRESIQSQTRFDELNEQANLYLAARSFGLLEIKPVLDHEKSQVRDIRVRAEHVVHQHEIDLIAAVEGLTACKDGTGKGALDDAENRVRNEACAVLIILGFGIARDLLPEDVPVPTLAKAEGVSGSVMVETEPAAESVEIDPVSGIAEAELNEMEIIFIPFELKGREKLPCVYLVAVILMLPKYGTESNPRGEMEEILLHSELAERLQVNHLSVFHRLFLQFYKIFIHATSRHSEIPFLEEISAVGVLAR